MDNTETLLKTLTKAVVFKYQNDPTTPGVTVASLRNGKFYASVVRYDGAIATGKKVVCNATADSIPDALKAVATKFLGTVKQGPKNPVDELDELVKDSK